MQTTGNKILITGGATGIGLALVEALLKEGNEVLICGRREDRLREVQQRHPQLRIRVADVGVAAEREALCEWALSECPGLNVLINNAGIQREIDFAAHPEEFMKRASELAINLEGPLHLTALLLPHLQRQQEAAVVNVSSGLALVPLALAPVYSATKAAIHSFSLSLRHQLKDTSVKVFEVLPPIVETELHMGVRESRVEMPKGIEPEVVAKETMKCLANNTYEVAVGIVKMMRIGARISPGGFFKIINKASKKN